MTNVPNMELLHPQFRNMNICSEQIQGPDINTRAQLNEEPTRGSTKNSGVYFNRISSCSLRTKHPQRVTLVHPKTKKH